MIIINGLAWIPQKLLTRIGVMALRRQLVVYPKATDEHADPQPITLWHEKIIDGVLYLGIPRAFYFKYLYHKHKDIEHSYRLAEIKNIKLNLFKGILRKEQVEAIDSFKSKMSPNFMGGIIQAPAGWGKTVVGIALIYELKIKTLILVHREFLVEQWIKMINSFLPEAKIGVVQGDICDYKDKDIVIGMLQSLSQKRYDNELYNSFNLVISDETHRLGSHLWSTVIYQFNAQYYVGITATARRLDRADNVFRYHIGDIIFVGKEQKLPVYFKIIETHFKIMNDQLSKSTLLKILAKNQRRNELIVNEVIKAVNAGRKILVLSDRHTQLKMIQQMLCNKLDGKYTVGYMKPNLAEDEILKIKQSNIILATYQLLSEAYDQPELDTLFLASPKGKIVYQAIGRILRPCEGKKKPIVVDFVDDMPIFRMLYESRSQIYTRLKHGN